MKFSLLSTEEVQLFRRRLMLVGAVLVVLFLVLVLRLWYLQVPQGDYYAGVSRGNRIRVMPQEAPRGQLFDRNGELLAYNRPAFNIQLIREDTPDLDATLNHLARIVDVPPEGLFRLARRNGSTLPFRPIPLLYDIGRKTADLIDTYQEDLPGISVQIEPKRLYPNAFLTAHLLGYVGAINEAQLQQLPLKKLRSGRFVGQSGVELMQNALLIGTDGGRQVEVDHVGRELRVLSEPVDPVPGNDIHLTIDLRLQREARTLMAGKNGVVMLMKPRTGEILSLNSFPDFDPNLFVSGIEDRHWERLTTEKDKPLLNRATQGVYPPGSTFKMVLAAAGLDQGVIDETTTYHCPGYYRLGRDIRYCWNRGGHGDVNVVEALAVSCNVFFYNLGFELGIDRISSYANLFGFGQPTGVELESEKAGLVPTREWKKRQTGERWYDGETLPVAIGQGFLNVTPLQLLNYVNIVANRGLWVRPTIFRRIITPNGVDLLADSPLPRDTRLLPVPAEAFDLVREGLVAAVNGRGTARRARSRRFVIAGKTGTSQVVGRSARRKPEGEPDEDTLAHALFVGFAPAHDPQVSVLVLVEHGEAGGQVAAPIGRRMLEYYFETVEPVRRPIPDAVATGDAGRRPIPDAVADDAGRAFARELRAAFGGRP